MLPLFPRNSYRRWICERWFVEFKCFANKWTSIDRLPHKWRLKGHKPQSGLWDGSSPCINCTGNLQQKNESSNDSLSLFLSLSFCLKRRIYIGRVEAGAILLDGGTVTVEFSERDRGNCPHHHGKSQAWLEDGGNRHSMWHARQQDSRGDQDNRYVIIYKVNSKSIWSITVLNAL